MRASERCVFLAVDKQLNAQAAMDLTKAIVEGPCGRHLAGVKLNDALHLPDGGPHLVDALMTELELQACFADLKVADVRDTAVNTLQRYYEIPLWTPAGDRTVSHNLLATVSINSSPKTFAGLREVMPNLTVAVMGIPTDWTPDEVIERYGMSSAACMEKWLTSLEVQYARWTEGKDLPTSPCDCAIASFDMLDVMGEEFPWAACITPGIRDEWMDKGNQERTAGVADAIAAGATYVVLGAQLIKGNSERGVSAEDSQRMTAEAIESALAA